MSHIRGDDRRPRRGRRLLAVGGSMLAAAALMIVSIEGCGNPAVDGAKTAASPAQPSELPASSSESAAQSSVPATDQAPQSFYPLPVQSAVDGRLGAMHATQILTYTPYADDLPRPDLVITATDSSMDSALDPLDCTAVSHDLEPLRCISPNGPMYDPCFPNREGSSCLFVASPTATDAVRMLLAPPTAPQQPQPSASPNSWSGYSVAHPWALDLTDGTECVFEHGAEDDVGGLRPNCRCSDGRFVFGNPDETISGWSVQLGASQSGPLTAKIGVTDAWIFATT